MTAQPDEGRRDTAKQRDEAERHETPTERLDRNWADLLQELRVVQTGVQLLTGVLLTVPFQQRFDKLSDIQRDIYLATVSSALCATILFLAPVSLHRLLFQRHERDETVHAGHRLALAGIVFLAATICGVAVLVFDVTAGTGAAVFAGVIVTLAVVGFWGALPLRERRKGRP